MRIKGYLQKIEQGKPLDLLTFKSYLRGLNLGVAHEIEALQARQVKPGRYVVTHVPEALMAALQAYAEADNTTRIRAAGQNRSHAASVSGSMLTIRRSAKHPQVVVFSADGLATLPFNQASGALIIENLENFLRIEQMFAFLVRHCGFDASQLQHTDIIFSNGNQIANKLHADFLNRYQQVDLLLDFDLGGFEIAASLVKMLAEIPVRFILPNDIEKRLEKIQSRIPHDDVERIISIANEHKQLIEAAVIMKKCQRALEQENYLE